MKLPGGVGIRKENEIPAGSGGAGSSFVNRHGGMITAQGGAGVVSKAFGAMKRGGDSNPELLDAVAMVRMRTACVGSKLYLGEVGTAVVDDARGVAVAKREPRITPLVVSDPFVDVGRMEESSEKFTDFENVFTIYFSQRLAQCEENLVGVLSSQLGSPVTIETIRNRFDGLYEEEDLNKLTLSGKLMVEMVVLRRFLSAVTDQGSNGWLIGPVMFRNGSQEERGFHQYKREVLQPLSDLLKQRFGVADTDLYERLRGDAVIPDFYRKMLFKILLDCEFSTAHPSEKAIFAAVNLGGATQENIEQMGRLILKHAKSSDSIITGCEEQCPNGNVRYNCGGLHYSSWGVWLYLYSYDKHTFSGTRWSVSTNPGYTLVSFNAPVLDYMLKCMSCDESWGSMSNFLDDFGRNFCYYSSYGSDNYRGLSCGISAAELTAWRQKVLLKIKVEQHCGDASRRLLDRDVVNDLLLTINS